MGNAKAKDLKVSLFNGITYKSKTINVEVDGKTTIFFNPTGYIYFSSRATRIGYRTC